MNTKIIAAVLALALCGCGSKKLDAEAHSAGSASALGSGEAGDVPYPYAAIITCSTNGMQMDPMICFSGSSQASSTNLELRNGDKYELYEPMQIAGLGERTSEGMRIKLAPNFELTMQNASDSLILGVKIVNNVPSADFNKVLFEKKVAQFGVIKAEN